MRTAIAIVSLLRPRDWRASEERKWASGSWGPHSWLAEAGSADLAERAVDVGDRVGVAAHFRLFGGLPPSCGWMPSGAATVWAKICLSVVRLPSGLGASTSRCRRRRLEADEGAVAVEVLA